MSGAPEPSNANSPVPSFLSTGEHDGLFLSGALDPPAHPGIFATLGGYHIVRQIGAGGMGIVFESRDPQNGGRLAIKLLRPELVGVGQAVHRFLVEARHMHELSHPHIVPVFAVEQRERGPFYVMPYMAGCSLAAKLGQPMDTAAATSIAVEIAEALVYAHVKGILHRDIKPANILLDDRGVSYLSDFGLVRTFFSDSAGGGIPAKYEGTAPYMSPNVAAGLKEDTRCDIYSFGATLYEMLTGTPPYEGRSSDEVVKKVLSGPPEPIRSKNPKASAALVKVAEACMARELRDRYAEMGDVLDDLRRAGRGEPIVGPHGAGRTVFRRTALIAAGVLAIGGMLAAAWNLNQSKAPITQRVNLPTSMPSVVAT
ncbi:MAG TPA: serine/threonine-protein kinase, partial [Tepidisphaeraceae bacterium]|nr:serine/threonine-protein kinase [Tepidisphaeraceae bacterium]